MWTIILAGFCIGVINVSQPAPVYKVTVKKIEDGLLQLDVNEICADAGYVRAKRDVRPTSSDHTTLLNDGLPKNTSAYSTTTESPSATVRIKVTATATEADDTVIAVNRTAKESDHDATMPTNSDDDETVTVKNVTVTDSDHEVTAENVTILMAKNITNHKRNQEAIMISDNATVMDSDHKINRTTENVTVTDQKVITKVKNVTATRSSHNVTVLAENFSDPGTMTGVNATITDSDRNGIMTAENVTVVDNNHEVNLTDKNVTAPRSGHDVSVTPQNDTGSGSDHNTTVIGGTKGKQDVNLTHTNDTPRGSDHNTNITIKKVKHDKTETTMKDTADGTENEHDKTVTVKIFTVNVSEHDVAPNPVDKENTDTAAQSTGAKPVVGAHDKSATSMSVLGILLISLVVAGVLIGISHIVYKIHKANSYVLPERNVPEATPLNHISR